MFRIRVLAVPRTGGQDVARQSGCRRDALLMSLLGYSQLSRPRCRLEGCRRRELGNLDKGSSHRHYCRLQSLPTLPSSFNPGVSFIEAVRLVLVLWLEASGSRPEPG